MVKAAEQAWKSMNDILTAKKTQENQEQKIKGLEEAARKVTALPEDIQAKKHGSNGTDGMDAEIPGGGCSESGGSGRKFRL